MSVCLVLQLDLSDNGLCGLYYDDDGELCGTYTSDGIMALSKALEVTGSLTTLNISANSIGNKGATAIAEALKVTGSLTEVNLLKNGIGMEAANQLAAVLPQHKTLKTLCGLKPNQTEASFSGQGLKPADAVLIAADLRVHGSLTEVLDF